MKLAFFDIETCPAPQDELAAMRPSFEAAANVKDPVKIAAQIAEKESDWRDKAALSALTGRVLAIVTSNGILEGSEVEILLRFWEWVNNSASGAHYKIAGFNIFSFDLPFLIRRSWKHRIQMPPIRNGRFWAPYFIDLRDSWSCGEYQASGSLDAISKHLGIGGKLGNGRDFARLYNDQSTKPQAIAYLQDELKKLEAIAQIFGL